MLIRIPLPTDCTLASIVCSYGFFRLPCNTWIAPHSHVTSVELQFPCDNGNDSSDGVSAENVSTGDGVGDSRTRFTLGSIPHGCFIRALRFGSEQSNAIFVSFTQETVDTNSETDNTTADNHDIQADPSLLTFRQDQQIIVRALFPPYADRAADRQTVSFSGEELDELEGQVCRMLRLDPCRTISPDRPTANPYHQFYTMAPGSRQKGFARLFRSPTIFEDLIKTITVCNVTWKQTINMNHCLTTKVGLGQRYRLKIDMQLPSAAASASINTSTSSDNQTDSGAIEESILRLRTNGTTTEAMFAADGESTAHSLTLGIFPSPFELAAIDSEELREKCRVGYRDKRIIELGDRFAHHGLEAEIHSRLLADTTPQLFKFLCTLNGFGPFAANNALAMLGRFDAHAFDSETVRHLREHHKIDTQFRQTSAQLLKLAKEHYSEAKYGKFIFLVYWFELWCNYEARVKSEAAAWTDTQFASFSRLQHAASEGMVAAGNGKENGATNVKGAKHVIPHWQLVAQQTRKRKQGIGLGTVSTSIKRAHRVKKRATENRMTDTDAEADTVDGINSSSSGSDTSQPSVVEATAASGMAEMDAAIECDSDSVRVTRARAKLQAARKLVVAP